MTVRALFVATFMLCLAGAATALGLEVADAPCLTDPVQFGNWGAGGSGSEQLAELTAPDAPGPLRWTWLNVRRDAGAHHSRSARAQGLPARVRLAPTPNPNPRRPLVHVGYPRAASTWLQKHLFSSAGFTQPFDKHQIVGSLVVPGQLAFDTERARAWAYPALCEAESSGRVAVVSSEMLCGRVFAGGWSAKELAARIGSTFGAPRILIVIREQRNALLSVYKMYLQAGGALAIEEFMDPPGKGKVVVTQFSLDHFRYLPLVSHYVATFGADSVLVLPFEQLLTEGHGFARRIAEFAGADVSDELPVTQVENASLPSRFLAFRRRINPLATRHALNGYSPLYVPGAGRLLSIAERLPVWDDPHRRVDSRWHAAIDHRTGDMFAEGNRALSRMMGIDLGRHGYRV